MIHISKRLLIVCEDLKSSKFYFESFKKDEKLKRYLASVSIEVVHPKDHSPVGLVIAAKQKKLKAKRERNPFSEIWIVLDRDYHENIDKAFNMAYGNGFRIALSIRCFEYWILLHFERTCRAFTKCDDTIDYIRKNHFADYLKSTNVYADLKDRIEIAIRNGKWSINQNKNDIERGCKLYDLVAYTDVHVLVERLLYPKDFILN